MSKVIEAILSPITAILDALTPEPPQINLPAAPAAPAPVPIPEKEEKTVETPKPKVIPRVNPLTRLTAPGLADEEADVKKKTLGGK